MAQPANVAKRQSTKRFSRPLIAALDACKYLGVRAGARNGHRFIHIWVVIVDGRAFARSWTLKADGWYRTFLEDPRGEIQIGNRVVRVRAVPRRGVRLWKAIEAAYAEKYPTRGSAQYVRGFRSPRRRVATMEFMPR
jgi:hypothetical protein